MQVLKKNPLLWYHIPHKYFPLNIKKSFKHGNFKQVMKQTFSIVANMFDICKGFVHKGFNVSVRSMLVKSNFMLKILCKMMVFHLLVPYGFWQAHTKLLV